MRDPVNLMPANCITKGLITSRSREHVIVTNIGGDRRLLFKILFGSQGDLYVVLPYFTPVDAILGHYVLPGNSHATVQVNMQVGGYTTSRNIKYAHHLSGEAHFSGDPKLVNTLVRTQSVPLADAEGHLFTVYVKGRDKFRRARRQKDQAQFGPIRTVIDFGFEGATYSGARFVGLWKHRSRLSVPTSDLTSKRSRGPIVSFDLGFGIMPTYLIAPPHGSILADRVLCLVCVPEAVSTSDHESLLVFQGGFDPAETMRDVSQDATFVAAKYPPSAGELPATMPTIDVGRGP